MEIKIAKELGFCFGVKRAADMTLAEVNGEVINTLGPLIHNPEFTKFLETRNAYVADTVGDIKGKKVVIRAHGIPKETEQEIQENNIEIIDATCPYVKRVQQLAEKYYNKGYSVFILGEKDHPEVIGIESYAPNSIVLKYEHDIPDLPPESKVALISQTTQKFKTFDSLACALKKRFKNVAITNTICDATEKRQKAAMKLAKEVEIMIVIGGKNSSNTTKLKEICGQIVKTHHIETEKELKKEWLKDIKTVGITAGASTPDFSIEKVVEKIKSINTPALTA
ncbi:TPA: 4-hydroxy-3-methylbut-2-enyl diphosphate reductase [candidate division CPR2 bacterium]|uniref:4-hydroxy-3-methylbut-2-enyl diphosphate reductase n=1 Tax=candidate division CPR2 bacterium GW2011_GWC1_41_48 TaxID=1618344 RepID=A0A0G0WCL2_UNCC2|nr:MAG: 4-hydroxy-3-methylbut-2-enyl diphosphate reductase [candidate division CPR2 bacterium GW2011_GWC2_39_35]KKR28150.1 MAG: 4-hydroxy-3-methylbut-2-enyl diphosphate reductase [candidate division CPR2 bacterium GW2011_GWD2_39_7]KKS09792.1 MAG: 4-hydroxy-3-methylbut-2-enyl diphosphate reductase [candidate division CPR2 bacterium GW2011_GWC1_41_48]OGB72270.1 MAG: 4-hydroxy-3-methylbut-2-enyl diphosphate reductase [candidate division CPR2 bacterium GWD2_39_7]HBG81588.1 4-hydroxy-3-methylbut-2-e